MEYIKITANNLLRDFGQYQKEFEDAAIVALWSGWYILGEQFRSFEEQFAEYNHANYCVGLASAFMAR